MFISLRQRKHRIFCWGALLAGIVAALIPASVAAIANPDTINIEEVRAYDSVLEDDDLLVIVKYTLSYTSLPDEIISDAYFGRFRRGTTELNAVEPFAFNDKGYGLGIFSFYWTASQKSTDSIEFDDTNSEAYTITLQGKVGVFTGSVPTTTTGTIIWEDATNTKELLFTYIKDTAYALENDSGWSDGAQNLIANTGGIDQFTATGEEYFANAVAQLQTMIPALFTSGVSVPDFTEQTFDTGFEDNLDTFWSGNWVETRFQNLADQLRVPRRTLTSIFAFFFMGLIAWFVGMLLRDTEHALAFGMLTFAVTLPMATAVNWVPLSMAMVIAFLCIIGLAWTFFGRRAGN